MESNVALGGTAKEPVLAGMVSGSVDDNMSKNFHFTVADIFSRFLEQPDSFIAPISV
jgi:hypothetical protein